MLRVRVLSGFFGLGDLRGFYKGFDKGFCRVLYGFCPGSKRGSIGVATEGFTMASEANGIYHNFDSVSIRLSARVWTRLLYGLLEAFL